MGSYNLFDFGKREHTVKERNAQLSAAELAVQLTKAKVAESVKNSFFQLERSKAAQRTDPSPCPGSHHSEN